MKNSFGLTFHHLGLAVRTPEKALLFLSGLGYTNGPKIYDEYQEVNLIFCDHHDMPDVEIIYPTSKAGPLDNMLSKNSEIIYHTCFESDDVYASVRSMKSLGHRVMQISPATPAALFKNRRVSFYLVRGFGLVELLETQQ
jgi:methylmalonyl-CoA/ethylmalonyl-CoA epimerase